MRINVLGQLEIVTDRNRRVTLAMSKTSQLLALLAASKGETVNIETIIKELWEDQVPRSVQTTLQTYVYHGRQLFKREALCPRAANPIVRRPQGYAIELPGDGVDASMFERLVFRARGALAAERVNDASAALDEALALWRGPVFTGIVVGSVLASHATYLEELKLSVIDLRLEVDWHRRRHAELIPQLRSLVVSHPLHEGFHARLIEALHLTGRRAEALGAYLDLRRLLDRELGVEPAPEIQRLQRVILEHGRPAAAVR